MNKILLVDDDLELTQLLTEILTLEGFEVTVAEDGEEGLQRLAEQASTWCCWTS
jgi:DNA-binding response OmpR family regulator